MCVCVWGGCVAGRLEEFRGKHKVDLCVVYGAEPLALSPVPGRADSRVVGKALFEALGVPSADQSFYLRPDRYAGLGCVTWSGVLCFKSSWLPPWRPSDGVDRRWFSPRVFGVFLLDPSCPPVGCSLETLDAASVEALEREADLDDTSRDRLDQATRWIVLRGFLASR